MTAGMIFTLAIMALIMSVPIVAIVTGHMRAVAEMKLKFRKETAPAPECIEAMRREIAELRDTTTRFDVSFDTALQRIEDRLTQVEARSSRSDAILAESLGAGNRS